VDCQLLFYGYIVDKWTVKFLLQKIFLIFAGMSSIIFFVKVKQQNLPEYLGSMYRKIFKPASVRNVVRSVQDGSAWGKAGRFLLRQWMWLQAEAYRRDRESWRKWAQQFGPPTSANPWTDYWHKRKLRPWIMHVIEHCIGPGFAGHISLWHVKIWRVYPSYKFYEYDTWGLAGQISEYREWWVFE